MIFSSLDELDVPKYRKLLALPIGGVMVTRREIRGGTDCGCGCILSNHQAEPLNKCLTCPTRKRWGEIHPFFPHRFSIGREFCVQAKRGGGALCGVCHKTEKEHIYYRDYFGKKATRVGGPCFEFKPARFKITGGCWHTDWLMLRPMPALPDNLERGIRFFEDEAKLEGFETCAGWEAYYPAHGIRIDQTWRILAERIAWGER